MGFSTVPDKTTGDVFTELMWDTYLRDNFNTGVPVLLATSSLGSTTASITWSSISQSWTHLMILGYSRGDTAATFYNLQMRFNGDTGANYDNQLQYSAATTTTAAETFGATSMAIGTGPAGTAGANLFGPFMCEIPFYRGAANNKCANSMYGNKVGTASSNLTTEQRHGQWRSNAAITSITLLPSAGNFVAGTLFSLYGMP